MKRLLLLLVLSSCSPAQKDDNFINAELLEYSKAFESNYGRSVSYIGLNFDDTMTGNVAGIAYSYPGEKYLNYIRINPKIWDRLSHEEKIVVVFHEYGHAELERNHLLTTDNLGNPVSIMYPTIINQYYFLANYNYLLDELFKRL